MEDFEVVDLDLYQSPFPDPESLKAHPDGLIAVGGDLSQDRLINAYRNGIFPWFNDDQPYLWWSPNPRCVFHLDRIRVSKSLKKRIKNQNWQLTIDQQFEAVMRHCAEVPRKAQEGTWITEEMIAAYTKLHQRGIAHSIEVSLNGELVGGLYGVSIGPFFFGESMFSLISDASKVALVFLSKLLKRYQFKLIDCQVPNPHLMSLGAIEMPRKDFLAALRKDIDISVDENVWKHHTGILF